MDKKQGFYLTLASNASSSIYPNNKIWSFRTKLAKPITFDEPYEVALIEIQYPRVWRSFDIADSCIIITGPQGKKYSIHLPLGFYNTIHRLVKEINYNLSNIGPISRINLQYDQITNKISIYDADGYTFLFKGRLAEMLGFQPGVAFSASMTMTKYAPAPYPCDIHGGCYNIFIYSDIVDYQLVGDTCAPLLRTINIADETRTIPTLNFDRAHYILCTKTHIDDVEIVLKSDQNTYIPFLYGKVLLKLHFKPVKTI